MKKRVNKKRAEIVSDVMAERDAARRRALIKDTIFPYLVEMNDTIGYSKIFLQSFSGLVESAYETTRKTITIGELSDTIKARLNSIFTLSDPSQKKEYDRYIALVDKLLDVPLQDLTYAAELPRYIDGFITKNKDKESITNVDITAILG